MKREFISIQKKYQTFIDELSSIYNISFINSLSFNGGGSKTYFYYQEFKNITPVNDIAIGSVFLMPEQFSIELSPKGFSFFNLKIIKDINLQFYF
jgi:hypothetical protein